MRYRITLYGFSEAEYRAMQFAFEYPVEGEPAYEVVETLADADFAIIDADSPAAVNAVVLVSRVSQAVFIGSMPPPGARSILPRPVDPAGVRAALAGVMTRHGASARRTPPGSEDMDDIVLLKEPPVLKDEVRLPPQRGAAFPSLDLPEAGAESVWEGAPAATLAPSAAPAPVSAAAAAPATATPTATGAGSTQASTSSDLPPAAASEKTQVDHVPRDKKAAARVAARRARLANTQTDPGALEHLRDVLVLDADATAAAQLRELLEVFGFRVHVAQNIAQAADVLAQRALVAAFLDVAVNGATDQGDGVTLLQTLQDLPRLVGHPTPAVLLVTARLRPSDKVRAALAGVNLPLVKPVSRGDVARALEACDIAFPADARRSR